MAPIFTMLSILLGGLFANVGSIPEWFVWLQWLSPARYGTEALLYNEFSDREDIPDYANPLNFFNFTLGYAASMFLLLALAFGFRTGSIIILKLFVTKFQ